MDHTPVRCSGRASARLGAAMPRESILTRTLVELADTLVADFDVVELLTMLGDRCVEVLDVGAAGIMLAAPDGELRVMASTSETMHMLELLELQTQEGACLDCFGTGSLGESADLVSDDRWPKFTAATTAAGFGSVNALPMRLRGSVIGALNLFHVEGGKKMPEADVVAAQAFADIATIAILQFRATVEAKSLNDQLNQALNSRILIEQAKGMVAERAGVDMVKAFDRLRSHARNHNRRLVDVAEDVINGELGASVLDASRPS